MDTMKNNCTIKHLIIVVFLLIGFGSFAQKRQSLEKLEAIKIGLISERLGLTPEQAQVFWPIYNEYSQKKKRNHEAFRQKRKNYNSETATDQETIELLELRRKTKSRELDLDTEYSQKMLTVIDSKQLLSLHEAERSFREKLLRQLEQRRIGAQNKYGGSNNPQKQRKQEQSHKENQGGLKNKKFNQN